MHGNLKFIKDLIVRGNKFYLFRTMQKKTLWKNCETIAPTYIFMSCAVWLLKTELNLNVLMSRDNKLFYFFF